MFENYPALLVTKLYRPRLRASHITRTALLAALDGALDHKLTLIAAAAGFGKTSLVADWSQSRSEAVGWLSLDDGDNDPMRFLSYLIGAVQTCQPQIGQELLAALQSSQPPTPDNAVRSLINQLAAVPRRLILVLDDYHVIENPTVHALLAFLVDHLPPHITLILLTRTDPPLPLARLRAKNDMLELRAAALRFSTEEIEQFLNQTMRFNLSADDIHALDTRTEGWIAGLQLAAIALETLPGERQSFIRSFTGSHRFVLDYLIEEVLSRQPDSIRRFLLETSILHRLNASLCGAVIGNTDGQAMLDYLDKHNLFLIPLDQSRRWYRYHHLFADLLQARLQAEQPTILTDLHQRAAHWHEANGFPEEAIDYALAAHDYDYAAQLITGPAISVTHRSEVMTLLRWYQTFPPDFVSRHPSMSLQFGLAFALNGRWNEAETLLSIVEQVPKGTTHPDETLMLAYLIATYHQDTARLAAIAAQASANPHPDRITKMVLALVISLSGDLRHACQLLAEVQDASERADDWLTMMTSLFHQCRFQVFLGNLHQAHALCQQALQRIHDQGSTALPIATFAHTALGRIFIEWDELDKANEHLSQALRLSELSGFVTGILSSTTIMLAEIKQAQGDIEGALQTAQTAIVYAERYDPPHEVLWLKTYQAHLWLALGNLPAVGEWLRATENHPQSMSLFYLPHIQTVTLAHALLNQRKIDEALTILTQMTAEPHNLLSVEALALLALARQAHGDSVHALLTLEQTLPLAEAENRVRAFLNLGAPMAKLLARFCEIHPNHEYAHKLLAMFPSQPNAALGIEPLGERELEVLRLIVAGHSNEEIAQTLVLALSTVKWYINTLYGKLHVKTRSQAIARTHELRLLD